MSTKFLVPFDGTALSEAALVKAKLISIALEEAPRDLIRTLLPEETIDVIAVSIILESARYARERNWIRAKEEFSTRRIVEQLHEQVTDLVPHAQFQFERVDSSASTGTISNRIRKKAREENVSMVFIGSDNAGRIVTPVSSVGSNVAAEQEYHVCIIRHPLPPQVKNRLKSEFFIPK